MRHSFSIPALLFLLYSTTAIAGSDLLIALRTTTTGPPWPPSEVVDEDGNFIAIGPVLEELPPGGDCFGIPDAFACFGAPRTVLISKETVPPLDENGKENFDDDLFGAAHTVLRELDLSPGSPDLDIVMYTASFGPAIGDFGGGPRIPRAGDSTYNLNSLPDVCPELFPTPTQATAYTRGSFPLHQAPIWGFEGDGVSFEPTSGEAIPTSPFPGPFPGGDSYEFNRDVRPRTEPITIGDWIAADQKSQLIVTLKDYNSQGIPTAAKFKLNLHGLIPHALYTVWEIRLNTLLPAGPPGAPGTNPRGKISLPGPLCYPNVISTDKNGKGKLVCELENPFRDPNVGGLDGLLRLVGVTVAYHPTGQSWGGCFARYGVAVDHTVHVTTGLAAFDSLFTMAKE